MNTQLKMRRILPAPTATFVIVNKGNNHTVARIRDDGSGRFHLYSVRHGDETHVSDFTSAQEAFEAFAIDFC